MTPGGPDEGYLRHALPLAQGEGRGVFRFALGLLGFALRYSRVLPVSPARWSARLAALPADRHLYFLGTLQQRRALERIVALDAEACVLDATVLPRKLVRRLALAALPAVWRAARQGSPSIRALLCASPAQALMAVAYQAAWREVFTRARPRCLVVASDTALAARAAVHVAREAGIPSVYLQHGCVTPAAPALATDYALLDGEQALEVYRAAGLGCAQASLVGVARLGGAPRAARSEGAIGVCGTHLTPVPLLLAAARLLQARFAARRIVVRPHPAQLRHWRFRLGRAGVAVSDSRRVTAAQFLERTAVAVAGSSSILMEAAVLGAAAVYCRQLDARPTRALRNETALDTGRIDYEDYYGFIGAGLCETVADGSALVEAVARVLSGPQPDRARARRYCDTIGGPFDGREHELALECIRRAARREPLPLRWP
jgi:hypothetical protein